MRAQAVVNFLAGSRVAEANPQADSHVIQPHSRPRMALRWTAHPRFLGKLRLVEGEHPANVDEDVYSDTSLPAPTAGADLLSEAVIWDCPDMTTWASEGYLSRLMEIAALADVLVYVASDERYNDEATSQFLNCCCKRASLSSSA